MMHKLCNLPISRNPKAFQSAVQISARNFSTLSQTLFPAQKQQDKKAPQGVDDSDCGQPTNDALATVMHVNFQPPHRTSDDAMPLHSDSQQSAKSHSEKKSSPPKTTELFKGEDFIAKMTVADILKEKPDKFRNLNVVSMTETETALSAAKRMVELNMGSILVVPSDIGGTAGMTALQQQYQQHPEHKQTSSAQTVPALGVFTQGRFVKAVLLQGKDPAKTTLREVMQKGLRCISSDQTLNHALNRFIDSRIRNLPVIENAHGFGGDFSSPHLLPRVSGVLSMTDFHRSLAQRISNYPFFEDTLVRDVLALPGSGLKFGVVEPTLDKLRVDHTATVQDVLKTMATQKSKFAFVHQGSSFIGLLTLRDCVRAIIEGKIDPNNTPVEKLMQTDIMVVTPDFPLHQAMKALIQSEKFILPVTAYIADTYDDDLRLAGVVSVLDVLQMFHYKYHLAKFQMKQK